MVGLSGGEMYQFEKSASLHASTGFYLRPIAYEHACILAMDSTCCCRRCRASGEACWSAPSCCSNCTLWASSSSSATCAHAQCTASVSAHTCGNCLPACGDRKTCLVPTQLSPCSTAMCAYERDLYMLEGEFIGGDWPQLPWCNALLCCKLATDA